MGVLCGRWSRRVAFVAAVFACLTPAASAGAKAPHLKIRVLSNRADLISSGDALVRVVIPKGVRVHRVRVYDDRRNVTRFFAVRQNGSFEGLVTGLRPGRNVLTARARHARKAKLVVRDHPNGGPVFSGPQMQPWVCQNGSTDPQCNKPATYSFQYKSSLTGSLQPYDPNSPPSDLATTTTDKGVTVPFIIRVETGYQDRDQYEISVLYDPAHPWHAWSPQKQWNHKLLITHGASCGIDHQSGTAPSTTNDTVAVGSSSPSSSPTVALGRGFAVMSTALDNAGHNCNLATQAESLVMAKERLTEQYGRLRYTIGTGCSGGSLTQQQVANAYPGVYQGILPQCSFPDAWSTGQQLVDYHLDRLYLEHPDRWGSGLLWTPLQIASVEGHPNHVNSIILDTLYWTALADPTNPCAGVTDEQRYNPTSNPGGTRCTLADDMINVFGRRPQSAWIQPEQQVGHGFAGLPIDNVGVQYGLASLKRGDISPGQFVDLNSKIGGGTIDLTPTPERFHANEPALRNAYRSGAINSANNMKNVAIIDLRGPDPGAFHDAYRSFAMRARIERNQGGDFRNHVIWYGQVPLIGDPNYTTDGLLAMDRWLSAVEADRSGKSLATKIKADRPTDVHDRCSQIDGLEQVNIPGIGVVCELPLVQTRFDTPRTVAGESIATDTNKCALKPLLRADYYPTTFTDPEWSSLQGAFPQGVCDWSKPGVDQRGTIPWQTYQGSRGRVIYGGRSLGPAPGGSGGNWTSSSFGSWRAAR